MRNIRAGFLFFLFVLLLHGCSCGCSSEGRGSTLRVGIDPNWYPIDFGSQEPYINGFTEDLLIEIARYSGVQFERITANWDNLYDGMKEKKYDAVISALPAYEHHKAKYEFSQNILDLGPVLIVPVGAQHTDLNKMGGELVGVVVGDPAVLQLQKYADIIIRNFNTIPDLLNAVVSGEIEGALLNRIPAINYVNDLYAAKLKIASSPMTDTGLRLIAIKGKHAHTLNLFNKSLEHLRKKKKLSALLKKWALDS